MKKRIERLIIFCMLITITIPNIAYAKTNMRYEQEKTNIVEPYGPKIEDLKSKDVIINNLQEIKRIRGNLTAINISESSTPNELKDVYNRLDFYIQEFIEIKKNLDNNIKTYTNSFSDKFFSEQVLFIAESYIVSLRQQQNLIIALQEKKVDAKKTGLFKLFNTYISLYYFRRPNDGICWYLFCSNISALKNLFIANNKYLKLDNF